MNASGIDRLTRWMFDSGPVLGVAMLYGIAFLAGGLAVIGGWVLVTLLNAVGIDLATPEGVRLVSGAGVFIGCGLMFSGLWISMKRIRMPEDPIELTGDMTDAWLVVLGFFVTGFSTILMVRSEFLF